MTDDEELEAAPPARAPAAAEETTPLPGRDGELGAFRFRRAAVAAATAAALAALDLAFDAADFDAAAGPFFADAAAGLFFADAAADTDAAVLLRGRGTGMRSPGHQKACTAIV